MNEKQNVCVCERERERQIREIKVLKKSQRLSSFPGFLARTTPITDGPDDNDQYSHKRQFLQFNKGSTLIQREQKRERVRERERESSKERWIL